MTREATADDATVTRNDGNQRYELEIDGEIVGVCVYRDDAGRRVLTHTQVRDELEGRGLGSQLIRFALEDIRQEDLRLVPQCPMVAAFVEKHDEYADLVLSQR